MAQQSDQIATFLDEVGEEQQSDAIRRQAPAKSGGRAGRSGRAAQQSQRKVSLPLAIIGVIGELMICTGAVLGLFVLWQVWWTNMEMSGEQDKQVAAIEAELPAVDKEKIGAPREGEPPAVPDGLKSGDLIGLMHIPALSGKQTTVIRQGESLAVLNRGGYGHYHDTAMPGEVGNFATAIHRDSYGSRVLHIDELSVGDPIIVETDTAWYVYKFTDHEIVNPTDVYVVYPDPYAARASADPNNTQVAASGRYLTITTCHPPLVSNKRWIVHAKFDHWVAREDGIPAELASQKQATQIAATGNTIQQAMNDAFSELEKTLKPEAE